MGFRPHFRLGLAGLTAIFVLWLAPSFAATCLSRSMTVDEIAGAIHSAPGCNRAMTLFQDCELGSSGDIVLGAAVEKKCESDFLDRLKAAQKAAYRREMGACDRKYRSESGTMYRSFTAFCRAEVAQRYSRRALKPTR